MRYFYSLILYLMLPWVLWHLWRRGARVPAYRRHWRERFGRLPAMPQGPVVWVHAVSVGEVRAAQPLVRSLQQRWPQKTFVMTTTTPTGRETVQRLFAGSVQCVYLPWDLPGAVKGFLSQLSPDVAIVMETEIWPNLYRALSLRGIPLLLVNARLSRSSMRGYTKLRGLTRATLQCVTHIAVQTDEDAQCFQALGASAGQLTVTGNLKLDAGLPADFAQRSAQWRESLGSSRNIWIAGSTHPGEERLLLEAHRQVMAACPGALLLLVPRHPERAQQVAQLCGQSGLDYAYSSQAQAVAPGDGVVIVDQLGELVYLYGAADVAFIGGSLVDRGGHNPVEAVLAGVPAVTGPHLDNFSSVYRELVQQNAVRCVDSSNALAEVVSDWFGDPPQRRAVAGAARRVVEQQQGALERTVALVESALPERA